jgi:tripartite-type tricarboxylate transporter receptor subunit TctC
MRRWIAGQGALLLLAASTVVAQGAANRPLRMVVPYGPGGNLDITARVIGPALSEIIGSPVVVENVGGAGGTIGMERVAKSPPDGHTVVLGSTGTITLAPILTPNSPYDPMTDLAPVGFVSNVPAILLVHPALPARSVRDYIALAKKRPGEITLGGAGTSRACDLFQFRAGIKVVLVRYYKGSAPGLIDLMGGHIDSMIDQLSSASSYVRSGRLRALAVASPRRAAQFPDIPTLDESGVKGAESNTYSGLLAPAGTPRDAVTRLNAALNKVLEMPQTRERLAQIGAEAWSGSPEQFAVFIRDDIAKWRRLTKQLDMKL